MAFATVAGQLTGALVGGLLGGDSGGSQQVSKDPWGPTQKPLTDMVNDGTNLYHYYQQNPFNSIQQTAYQNLFNDLDAFAGQDAGLMDFANRLMGQNYSRTGGQQMQTKPMGLLGSTQRGQAQAQGPGLLGGPFFAPQNKAYGNVDVTQFNPWTNGGIKPPETPAETDEEKARRLKAEEEQQWRNSGEWHRGEGA